MSISYVAKTLSGLESVLAEELNQLGAKKINIVTRAVEFEGDEKLMYKVNYWSRTALRILKPLFSFEFNDVAQFYQQLYQYNWDEIMHCEQTLAIDVAMAESVFTNSHFVAQKAKDAIADYFRKKYNKRPSVNTENPNIRINIYIYKKKCSVALDSSGESLHKRGYKIAGAEAPISEVLAAGMLYLSGWDKNSVLVDPMCGSGTICLEAALMAHQIPAGFWRKNYGFENWKTFNADLWKQVKNEFSQLPDKYKGNIYGSDISSSTLNIAKANLKNSRLDGAIHFSRCDFKDYVPPTDSGWVIFNPPYGERIKSEDLISFYQSFGDILKAKYTNYQAWIISSDTNALKFIGLKPSQKIKLFNGPLECRFFKFEIYSGSKKTKYQQQ